ncbi:Nucleolar RNA helicase 2 [Gaertneriomyces sp. JEL0708]|nr:Nucleolar RNA helicase 2 [Gaertneriomyces sp. JEL0708]
MCKSSSSSSSSSTSSKEKKEKKDKKDKKDKKEKKEKVTDENIDTSVKKRDKKSEKKSKKVDDVNVPIDTTNADQEQKEHKKDKKRKRIEENEEPVSPAVEEGDSSPVKKQRAEDGEAVPIPEIPENLRLSSHGLSPSTLKALEARGVTQLFPIQAASLKPIMDGKDLLGRARTGTGKTLAFSLPMIEVLKRDRTTDPRAYTTRGRMPKVLIMAPTRELAMQVHKEFDSTAGGELATVCVYGGTPYNEQYFAMRDGVDVVVGTPGRIIDHIDRGNLKLGGLKFVCLDEADQMLDIGFADAMEKVLQAIVEQKASTPNAPSLQTLLFSATLPDWIAKAVSKYMKPDKATVDMIGKDKHKTSDLVKHYAVPSRWQNRASVLGDIVAVYGRGGQGRTIVFVETKGECNELGLNEKMQGFGTQVIHGDVQQKQREVAMQGFRDGKFKCLIATNVCARGVDIPEVDLVINCEPPSDVDTYIHRSGRTGRAGKSGVCVTFYKTQQEYLLQAITRRAGVEFTRIAAPQPKDIVSARATDTLTSIKTVDARVLPYFNSTAESLLTQFDDPVQALSATLALLCNTTKPLPPRSLLSANEGYYTLLFRLEQPIRNVGYVRAICQRTFPNLTFEDTMNWRMCKDEQGAVVDVVAEKVEISEDTGSLKIAGVEWRNGRGVTLEIATELPDLQERPQNGPSSGGYGSGGYGSGGYSGGNNQNGGYGGRGGYNGSSGRGAYGSSSRGGSRGGSFGGRGGRGGSRGGRGRGGY